MNLDELDAIPENVERERRFLVTEPSILEGADWNLIVQAYVFAVDGYAIRVRRERERIGTTRRMRDLKATLTMKGPRVGDQRSEFEMEVDPVVAAEVIARSVNVVEKRRHSLVSQDQTWDVDVFLGPNHGLMIAELEGRHIRGVKAPWWASVEVTADSRYNNDSLAFHPFSQW